jgi:hypothetical protein
MFGLLFHFAGQLQLSLICWSNSSPLPLVIMRLVSSSYLDMKLPKSHIQCFLNPTNPHSLPFQDNAMIKTLAEAVSTYGDIMSLNLDVWSNHNLFLKDRFNYEGRVEVEQQQDSQLYGSSPNKQHAMPFFLLSTSPEKQSTSSTFLQKVNEHTSIHTQDVSLSLVKMSFNDHFESTKSIDVFDFLFRYKITGWKLWEFSQVISTSVFTCEFNIYSSWACSNIWYENIWLPYLLPFDTKSDGKRGHIQVFRASAFYEPKWNERFMENYRKMKTLQRHRLTGSDEGAVIHRELWTLIIDKNTLTKEHWMDGDAGIKIESEQSFISLLSSFQQAIKLSKKGNDKPQDNKGKHSPTFEQVCSNMFMDRFHFMTAWPTIPFWKFISMPTVIFEKERMKPFSSSVWKDIFELGLYAWIKQYDLIKCEKCTIDVDDSCPCRNNVRISLSLNAEFQHVKQGSQGILIFGALTVSDTRQLLSFQKQDVIIVKAEEEILPLIVLTIEYK